MRKGLQLVRELVYVHGYVGVCACVSGRTYISITKGDADMFSFQN